MAHVLAELKIVPKTQDADAADLARELGLALQARRYEKPLAENVFTPLTADEVTIWHHHCPTAYVTTAPADGQKSLADYGFDSIPVEVMRHWKSVKDNYNFDTFQVWTTERTRRATDPLLIGIIGQKLYLLARWGLESPENESIVSVCRELLKGSNPKDVRHWQEYSWAREDYRVNLAAVAIAGFPMVEKAPQKTQPNFLQKMLGMGRNEP